MRRCRFASGRQALSEELLPRSAGQPGKGEYVGLLGASTSTLSGVARSNVSQSLPWRKALQLPGYVVGQTMWSATGWFSATRY
jgi:hypothetical protein